MPDNSQNRGKHLDLSCKPHGLQLELFIDRLEDCIRITKHCSTPTEAFDVIFGQETASLLGFSKGYVGAVDLTEETVSVVYYIMPQRWELDGDKETIEHFAGFKRPTRTNQGKLVKFMQQYRDSYITPDFKQDENFSQVLRESVLLKTVIVSPFVVFDEVIGLILLGYPDYPSPETQWMHEHLITHSALPVTQAFWLSKFKEELERTTQWRLLGQQAAALAHGLKTPIAALDLFFGLLDSQGGNVSNDRSMTRDAEVQFEIIRSITNNLLSFVHEVNIDREEILVKELIQGSIDSSLPQAKKASITGNALEKAIRVDLNKIILVLQNLINNAYESVRPEFSNKSQIVEIRANGDEEELTIAVLDNGIGIPEDSKEKIFRPSYTTKDEGHGLGLAVAQRFVNAHGGRIVARNRREGGACFEVILPWQVAERG